MFITIVKKNGRIDKILGSNLIGSWQVSEKAKILLERLNSNTHGDTFTMEYITENDLEKIEDYV